MFKRVTWLGVGFGIGVGTTVVAARKAKQQMERYKPVAVVDRTKDTVVDGMVRLRDQLAAAVDDGKVAAREREAALLARRPEGRGVKGRGKGGFDGEISPDRPDESAGPATTL
jgi:hypothetical protein